MVTEIELFLRKRIENDIEIWDVAESEVKAPSFYLDVDNFNSNIPKVTNKGGFVYYPKGSELPKEYVDYLKAQEELIKL